MSQIYFSSLAANVWFLLTSPLRWQTGLEIIFSKLPVKMTTSTNEFVSVIKQNVLVIIPQKQEISQPILPKLQIVFPL